MNASSSKRRQFFSRLIVIFLICCWALVLSSCSRKASTAIIGKWRVQSTKETVEFHKDGTIISSQQTTAGPPGNEQTVTNETTGTYTFTDASHMNLQINTSNANQPTMSVSCEVHIDGDKMNVTATVAGSSQPQRSVLRRVK